MLKNGPFWSRSDAQPEWIPPTGLDLVGEASSCMAHRPQPAAIADACDTVRIHGIWGILEPGLMAAQSCRVKGGG